MGVFIRGKELSIQIGNLIALNFPSLEKCKIKLPKKIGNVLLAKFLVAWKHWLQISLEGLFDKRFLLDFFFVGN